MEPVYKAAIYSAALASFIPILLIEKNLKAHLPNKQQWSLIIRKIAHQYMQLHMLRYHWFDFETANIDRILKSSNPETFARRINRTAQTAIPIDTIYGCTLTSLTDLCQDAVKGHCDHFELSEDERVSLQEAATALVESTKTFLTDETELMDAVTTMAETFRLVMMEKDSAIIPIPALKYQHADYDEWGIKTNTLTPNKIILQEDPLRK